MTLKRKRNSLEQARAELRDAQLKIRSLQMQLRAAAKTAYIAGLIRGSQCESALTDDQAADIYDTENK